MKALYLLLGFSILISSCGNNKADQPGADDDSATAVKNYSWEANLNDSSGRLEMKTTDTAGPDSLTIPSVIEYLNKTNPNIKLEFVRSVGDTLYLKIPEATYLTQQMGSTGPTMYLATAVYNLTEIPGIRNVSFDFEEGDHAQPGTFARDNFKDE